MGIKYDKEKGISRTLCVNEVFRVIHAISKDYKDRKTKSDSWLTQKSPYVEKRRLERPTPTSRTWCATNCATSRRRKYVLFLKAAAKLQIVFVIHKFIFQQYLHFCFAADILSL